MLKVFGRQDALINELNSRAEKSADEILVIGAGLPRTGTLSLKTALSALYGAKCYHGLDIMTGDQEDVDLWNRAAEGEVTADEWRKFFKSKSYVCGVDFPFCLYYKELMKAYPEAKVILSTRDPAAWYRSVANTIWKMNDMLHLQLSKVMLKVADGRQGLDRDFFRRIQGKQVDGCRLTFEEAIGAGEKEAVAFFKEWEAEVRRSVPAERLLVHRASSGWGPLCRFLGRPVPDQPYPRLNDTSSMRKRMRNMRIMNAVFVYSLPLAVVAGLLCFLTSRCRQDIVQFVFPS